MQLPTQCELHVTLNLFTEAYRLYDADSHFFQNQKNSYSCSLFISGPMHSNIYVRTLGYQKRNKVGNLMENDLNLVANSVCALA
jgi:hypothetical protein